MLTLFLTVALGIVFAVFATQNTGHASIYFGDYSLQNVPVYIVVLIPLLIGLSSSFVVHLIKSMANKLSMSKSKNEIKNLKEELTEITKEAHKLELENTKLKAKTGEFDEDSI
ncbi:hypothetical protein A2130_00415 [Candidatus Woesebacteria bacterium GWC2_33_12]|uniref:Lipopolysaccharide assembly protein A domain-containing protein n=1 Tax=Candidatus Woesebacteria bacterium GW2011_GWB1_33_22 TaxID=1618566 RepID=A0A0G0CKL8_9BACT|nr:MAG: hypothetical protein UR29_C0008G0032 [Candidatus Woesebacteria bacterium GW2011_GWC2_33_12]KKP41534.1 MAG: hypothetical protein UR33_C0013G0012 [Candidatus Woesebacteria bacterium GW2011_GWA2_33_20]KKP43987.1 MAG: hypothetical protein UR35_C0013G0012 [Candidatus Woesebacteria bacterium GW2011_GWB1_33_22]KKP46572.1 MAG: hypothetical protein UR37_C0006G0022 [Microgenomates group bacterium GW2011_GWC1_33_28]KKP49465.1 MAG: hypothetical protein UR41_C0014G0012 [Candidatus Woesebacteria bact